MKINSEMKSVIQIEAVILGTSAALGLMLHATSSNPVTAVVAATAGTVLGGIGQLTLLCSSPLLGKYCGLDIQAMPLIIATTPYVTQAAVKAFTSLALHI